VGFLACAVAVFLFYPAMLQRLNSGSNALQIAAAIMFYAGLLVGILGILFTTIFRATKAPNFKKWLREQQAKRNIGIFRRTVLKNWSAALCLLVFLVGLIGSIISIAVDESSSYHTFAFLACTVLGLSEYFVFNSINFMYLFKKGVGE
jgi:hypothetical protein